MAPTYMRWIGILLVSLMLMSGCARWKASESMVIPGATQAAPGYVIGPGDTISIFVWRNNELSTTVPVRPDGRISTPLIEDVPASGKTPTELARMMEEALSVYVKRPVVTVIVQQFEGPYDRQVRVVGQATRPQALPYREKMTVLDVMIAVGGLTEFAAGNRATLVRTVDGAPQNYRLRIDDLLNDGDMQANVRMLPGDILIIPEAWF